MIVNALLLEIASIAIVVALLSVVSVVLVWAIKTIIVLIHDIKIWLR